MSGDSVPAGPGGTGGVSRAAALMAAGTATSRVLGMVRNAVVIAAITLNSGPAGAFAASNTLPTALYMLIAGGVVNAVLVPQVVRAYRSPNGQAYVDRLLTLSFTILLGVTVLLTVAAPVVIRLSVGGEKPEFVTLATTFAFWCLPQVFFYGTYTLLGQVLNARGSFGPYMWAPVVNNIVAITGMVVFIAMFGQASANADATDFSWWHGGQVALVAGFATLGVLTQAVVLIIPLYRSGFRYRPRWDWRGAGLGTAGRVAAWTFAALAAGQLGALVVLRVSSSASQASDYQAAGNNVYNFAFTVFMLPHSLVTVSLLTAMFTRLSSHAAAGDRTAVRADFSYGLRTIGVFTVFATAVLAVLALPIARVTSPGTTPQEASTLAPVIVTLLVGLVALGAWSLCQRVSYAYEDARSLFWIQVAMAGVVAGGTLLGSLVLPVGSWTAAAGAAISASYVLGAVWGGIQVRSRLGGGLGRVLRVHARAAVAAGVAAAVGWPVSRRFGDLSSIAWSTVLLVCVVVGLLMLGVYLGMLRLMGVTEVSDLLDPLVSRLGRSMGTLSPLGRGRQDRRRGGQAGHGGDLLESVVGRGTLLAGRYRLDEPAHSDLRGVDAWTARDQILDRPVRALVLREGRVRQAQDAARRAALVNDPRLLRVLDVGEHEGLPYAVTEPLLGHDLAELTADGPLPADQARAIIGEAAVALEVARRRGVHHLALRPSTIRVTPEGRVVVSGLAMDGELAGHGLGDARSTTRADTVGLVALLYLALTGRWPAPAGTHADPSVVAPTVEGSPVPPVELAPGVPNDLDTLCAVTLGPHDDGPHSPAELVRELEPWGPLDPGTIFHGVNAALWSGGRPPQREGTQMTNEATGSAGANEATGSEGGEVTTEPAPEPRTVQRQSVRSTFAEQTAPPARPGTPPPAIPPAFHRTDPRTTTPAARPVSAASAPTQGVAMPVTPPVAGPSAGGSPAPSAGGSPGGPTAPPVIAPPVIAPPVIAPPSRPAAARGHGPAAASPDGPLGLRPHARAPRDGGAPARPVDHENFDTLIGRSTEVLTQRRFDPTPFVLGIVALAVVIGLVMAWNALTAPPPPIGDGSLGTTQATPGAEETTAPDVTAAPEAPAAEEAPPAPAAPVIASAQMLDPPPGGDNNEHPEAVPLALDGDPTTFWYTRTYNSPTYGMKPGVGYAIALAAPATVTTVTLTVNGTGGMVEVRSTDPTTPTAGDVLASGPLSPQTVLTLSAPTETQSIVLWFTALPQTPDGKNRVELAEVALS